MGAGLFAGHNPGAILDGEAEANRMLSLLVDLFEFVLDVGPIRRDPMRLVAILIHMLLAAFVGFLAGATAAARFDAAEFAAWVAVGAGALYLAIVLAVVWHLSAK